MNHAPNCPLRRQAGLHANSWRRAAWCAVAGLALEATARAQGPDSAASIVGAAPSSIQASAVLWRLDDMARIKQVASTESEHPWTDALAALREEADEALALGPYSVMHKEQSPPSGDKHDYMSQGPYWWPDPKSQDGLPYVKRDGVVNPEYYAISDERELQAMSQAVETLALGYYYFDDEKYAQRAAQLLRIWFLDPATRMNPHMKYGQGVPGLTEGRCYGLIESSELIHVVAAMSFLESSPAWSAESRAGLGAWFADFLAWIQSSELGRRESREHNNHGTYHDAQASAFALFIGQPETARTILEQAAEKRIAAHVQGDGRQPHELSRTRSWSYCVMNLRGLIMLASMGDAVGIDLWGYESPQGGSIRGALAYLTPFGEPGAVWPYKEISQGPPTGLYALQVRAATKFADRPALRQALERLDARDRVRLTTWQ